MTQHLAFIRKFDKVAIVVTVVDVDSLKDIPNESFVVATTQSTIYSNMLPQITLSKQPFEPQDGTRQNETKGNSIDGILCSPNWFIRKVKTGLESLIS